MGFPPGAKVILKELPFFKLLCHQMGIILENAHLYKSIQSAAITDPLTGILNRREWLNKLSQAYSKAKRSRRSFGIIMLDLDHFKAINDNYGHDGGDFVLIQTVKIILDDLREEDSFGRYGGEEFLIVLEETPLKAAYDLANRLREKIENHNFQFRSKSIPVTASFGITELQEGDSLPQDIITRVDKALYQAKESGRNRCVSLLE